MQVWQDGSTPTHTPPYHNLHSTPPHPSALAKNASCSFYILTETPSFVGSFSRGGPWGRGCQPSNVSQQPVLNWIRVFVNSYIALITRPSLSPVLITSLFFFFWHGNDGQLGWFVFIRIRNTKPWNHFHMCTVVLWTNILVEFMLLWSGL